MIANIELYLLPGRTAQETLAQLQIEKDSEPINDFQMYMEILDTKDKITKIRYNK